MNKMQALKLESQSEILKIIRAPEFIIPTLIFPVLFYLLFGVILSEGTENPHYLMATYGVFAVLGPAIFGFGIAVANERTMGWLSLKRTSPVPAYNYILAKVLTTLLFAAISVAFIYIAGILLAEVSLSLKQWSLLFITHMLGTLPFILIGLLIGFVFKANTAIAFANLAFLGLAVLGGLWIPIYAFPKIMQSIAEWLPSYHISEIALHITTESSIRNIWHHIMHVLIMTGFLLIAVFITWHHQKD